ncbi:MAG: branched-chain amino acid ABC transporter permease [Limnochordia bacterium]|jgi:branched-chain amino acid transport system permease protein
MGLQVLGVIDEYLMVNIKLAGVFIILGTSLNLINGFTGQFSLGHAGFMSVGAYVGAICTVKFDLPFPVALIIGALAAACIGLLIGLPTLRLRGDYLAIATLGLGEIIRVFFLNWAYVGGAHGLMIGRRYTTFTWLYASVVLSVLLLRNWIQSAHGRACIAVREDEIAASAMGINTTTYKVAAFTIGAFFAGLAGVLYAHAFFIISPQSFGFLRSVEVLIIVVLGGMGSLTGSVLAAILLTFLSMALAPWPYQRMIVYSLSLILMMVFRPTGLMGTRELELPSWLVPRKEGQRVGGAS